MAGSKVSIDGGILEGGGQILRISTSLAAILGIPVRIYNIRGNRPKPGLRPQHLTGLEVLRDLTGGRLLGGQINSTEVTFEPGNSSGSSVDSSDQQFVADTGTAGSVTLLLQSCLPPLLFFSRPRKLLLKGGTNADFAPPIDYTTGVLIPILSEHGIKCDISMERRGFFPRGGGQVHAEVFPLLSGCIKPFNLTQFGKLVSIEGVAQVAGNLPVRVAEEMRSSAEKALRSLSAPKFKLTACKATEDSVGSCCWMDIVARTDSGVLLGNSVLLGKGERGSVAGERCGEELREEIVAASCADRNAVDQLIIFMALAQGTSAVRCLSPISLHTKTAIHVAELMTQAKFRIREYEDGRTCVVECDGIGWEGH